jgi:hypothetical protein
MFEDKSLNLYGFFRAEVVDNKDPKKFGRIKVWIPDIMPKISRQEGLWAAPANNAIGGLNKESGNNESSYYGSCLIPRKNSFVLIFFENGNPNKPYYFAALNLQKEKVLPECQIGENYEDKWVLFKSSEGRCIVVSDDPFDCRVEITGKKRKLKEPPSGDLESVYEIDGNQTTILLDERQGKEKILIRTHKGDYINFDIENQKLFIKMESDIEISSKGKILFESENGISLKSKESINIQSSDDINVKSMSNVNIQSANDINIKSSSNLNCKSDGMSNYKAGGPLNSDGSIINDMMGQANDANEATDADSVNPIGERD